MPQENHPEDTQSSVNFSFEEASQIYLSTSKPNTSLSTENRIDPYSEKYSQCSEDVRVVWGTTINIQETIEQFKEFMRTNGAEEGKAPYLDILDEIHEIEVYIIHVDCRELRKEKYQSLYTKIIRYPVEILPLLEIGATDLYLEKYPSSKTSIKIVLTKIENEKKISDLLPTDIDTLIEVVGMVTKCSTIIPDITTASFVCNKCKQVVSSEVLKGVIAEPVDCSCGAKFSMELDHTRSRFQDKQIIKIQELPEKTNDGTVPGTISVIATSVLSDQLIPGDKVKLAGIYRAAPIKLNYLHSTIKSSFRTYLEAVSFTKLWENEEKQDLFDVLSSIEEIRKSKNIYEELANSLAPSIYGMLDVKKALLLQLFGGLPKNLNGARFRGDINVLLAGDPGVAKSQLLLAVHRLMDRGVYTSGKGSSAVGLTANVARDPESGQFILESGALVISDEGLCCIDEFDKMDESTRSILHEAMEQQTVSVAKAGIITTLNARCSILAACNPISSTYDPKKNIIENLHIPPTLLSRFDIVCLLLDKIDAKRDREISTHIIQLYAGEKVEEKPKISQKVLKEYIKEGRKINPKITQKASEEITSGYLELRQLGSGKSVTATTRQLESIIRLSEAHARMRLSDAVDPQDVQEAMRLIKDSLHIYAIDPITGRIDMELLHTGKTSAAIEKEELLKEEVMKVLGKGTTFQILLDRLLPATRVTEKSLSMALNELQEEGKLIIDGYCITPN
ncbi:DNA replication licensing factor MCM4 [Nematocida sp. LUAm3]|nr:DNA replication licensing factor MCM4 [Nematocida sp. LUAm3]KAI5174018.1 DNA replication licensing factor MCM4 [Nematocida sp. LUAm2]KAI5177239.1 DNA replication licensing factor MCM4 [Nematocida sp. LUAm1]